MQWEYFMEFVSKNSHGAIEKITQNWQIKTIIGILGAWAVSIYEFVGAPITIFVGIIAIDFLSKMLALGHCQMKKKNIQGNHLYAIWYGFRNNEASQSCQMRSKNINKIIQYMFILAAVFLLGKIIPPTFSEYSTFAFDWIIFYLSVGEVKSIFENLQEAGMEEAAFFISFFGAKKKQLEDKMNDKK